MELLLSIILKGNGTAYYSHSGIGTLTHFTLAQTMRLPNELLNSFTKYTRVPMATLTHS